MRKHYSHKQTYKQREMSDRVSHSKLLRKSMSQNEAVCIPMSQNEAVFLESQSL